MFSGVNCRDPHDFEPDQDTLLDPPAAPQLLEPDENYVYMATTWPSFYVYVNFSWAEVSGAEEYTLELAIDTFAPAQYPLVENQWTLLIMNASHLGNYWWRVRAYSALWKFYTEWSETGHFEARRQPDGPELLYPANNQQFTFDSLPEAVTFQWRSVADETYYEIMIGYNTDTLSLEFANDTCSAIAAETTGVFWWQVRAGSQNWQCASRWSGPRYFIINLSE